MKRNKINKAQRIRAHLKQVNLFAAGIDIGSRSHFVAVPEALDEQPVREFAGFTGDVNRLADWLVEMGIETVAMESTGVYWIPVYEILESRGLEVLLVDARHVKNVPGHKTDVLDCQWIQQLHTYGLLRGAFRPPEEMVALRSYLRQRESLIASASDCIRHMQKALRQMNLLLDNVVSDITGMTGLAIIRAILAGERDTSRLAKLRDKRCRSDERMIAGSLEGHYREEHLFALQQSVECYDFYQQQIEACEGIIERHMREIGSDNHHDQDVPPASKPKGHSKNGFDFDVRSQLYRLTGVDLTEINGMSENNVLTIVSETGLDMNAWPTEKHFASWALSVAHHLSGIGAQQKVFQLRPMGCHHNQICVDIPGKFHDFTVNGSLADMLLRLGPLGNRRFDQLGQLLSRIIDHFGTVIFWEPGQLRGFIGNNSDNVYRPSRVLGLIYGRGQCLLPGALLSQVNRYQDLFKPSHFSSSCGLKTYVDGCPE